MWKIPAKHSWTLYSTIGVIVLLLVLGGGYYVYVQQHTDELHTYYLRRLHKAAQLTSGELQRLHENVGHAINAARLECEVEPAETVRAYAGQIRAVTVRASEVQSEKDREERSAEHIWFTIERRGEQSLLQIHLYRAFSARADSNSSCSPDGTASPDSETTEATTVHVDAEASLGALFRPFVPVADFGKVLLVDTRERRVLGVWSNPLRSRELPLVIRSLGDAGAGGDEHDETPAFDTMRLGGTPEVAEVRIGGRRYVAFVQPVHVPIEVVGVAGEPAYPEWSFVGLKTADAFDREQLYIPDNVLLGVGAILLILLLGLPILKIQFMGPHDRLRGHDLFVLATALIMLASMITFVALWGTAYIGYQQKRSATLSRLAEDVSEKFDDELTAAQGAIRVLADALPERAAHLPFAGDLLEAVPLAAYPFVDLFFAIDTTAMQRVKWAAKETPTPLISVDGRPYFENVSTGAFWRDTDASAIFLESIRGRTNGAVSAVVSSSARSLYPADAERPSASPRSHAVIDSFGISVIAASIKLVTLHQPVMMPGYAFSIVDPGGRVLFDSDSERNLRVNLFEELNEGPAIAATIEAGQARELYLHDGRATYHAQIVPLVGRPTWALLVTTDVKQGRLLFAQILLMALQLLLLHHAILIIGIGLGLVTARMVGQRKPIVRLFQSLWIDEASGGWYGRLVGGAAVVLVVWLALLLIVPRISGLAYPMVVCTAASLGLSCLTLAVFFGSALRAREASAPKRRWADARTHWLARHWRKAHTGVFWMLIVLLGVMPAGTYYYVAHTEVMEARTKFDQHAIARAVQTYLAGQSERFRAIRVDTATTVGLVERLLPPSDKYSGRLWYLHVDSSLVDVHFGSTAEPDSCRGDNRQDLLAAFSRFNAAWMPLWEEWPSLWHSARTVNDETHWVRPASGAGRDVELHLGAFSIPALGRMSEDLGPVEVRPRIASTVAYLGTLIQGPWSVGAVLGFVVFGVVLWLLLRHLTVRIYPLAGYRPHFISGDALRLPAVRPTPARPGRTNGVPHDDLMRHRLILRKERTGAAPRSGELIIEPSALEEEGGETIAQRVHAAAAAGQLHTVVLDRFHEGLDDPARSDHKLYLLEKLSTIEGIAIRVYSDINPLHVSRMRLRDRVEELPPDGDAPTGNRAIVERRYQRWVTVLRPFVRERHEGMLDHEPRAPHEQMRAYRAVLRGAYWAARRGRSRVFYAWLLEESIERIDKGTMPLSVQPPGLTRLEERFIEWVARECWPKPYLREIGRMLVEHPDPRPIMQDERFVQNQVGDLAEASYSWHWTAASKQERLVLYNLCIDGFVSWHSGDILRRLVHLGLVVQGPCLRPMNESFCLFIREAESPGVIARWREGAGTSTWKRLLGPLVALLVIVSVFLFTTQPDVFDQSLALVTGITAGIPALLKLFAMMFDVRLLSGK